VSLRTAVEYVAAVYLLSWVVICAYMVIMFRKISRIESELDRLERGPAEPDA
jgi:CcmD family protein